MNCLPCSHYNYNKDARRHMRIRCARVGRRQGKQCALFALNGGSTTADYVNEQHYECQHQ
jgi:hypothetical protein